MPTAFMVCTILQQREAGKTATIWFFKMVPELSEAAAGWATTFLLGAHDKG